MAKNTIQYTSSCIQRNLQFFDSIYISIFLFNFCCSKKSEFSVNSPSQSISFWMFPIDSTVQHKLKAFSARARILYIEFVSYREIRTLMQTLLHRWVAERGNLHFPVAHTRCWRLCWCSKRRFSRRGKSGAMRWQKASVCVGYTDTASTQRTVRTSSIS